MLRVLLTAVALGTLPLAAPAAVVHSSPGGFTIENSVIVPVKPREAWNALVDDVDDWWPKDHSWFGEDGVFRINARAGGCFCEYDGKRESLHMLVTFVNPPELLRMTGGLGPLQGMGLNGALEWRFEEVEDGSKTKITLHYVAGGYSASDLSQFAPTVDQVQALQLGGLAAFLRKDEQ